MKLKHVVLTEINRLNLGMVHTERFKNLVNVTVPHSFSYPGHFYLTLCVSGVPSAGPASQVQELRTWREHYKVSLN